MNLKALTKEASGLGAIALAAAAFYVDKPCEDGAYPRWLVVAAKISLVCSALSSPFSVFACGWVLGNCLPQYADFFGPNTAFVINGWHPKHVLSMTGAGLGVVVLVVGLGIAFFGKKKPSDSSRAVVSMAAVHTIVSRPALHVGNWLLWRCTGLRWN